MSEKIYRSIEELDADEKDEYTSVSWQILIYVAIGISLGFLFDRIGYSGYFSEAIVRAIAGTADTMGLMLAAILTVIVGWFRRRSVWADRNIRDMGNPKAVTWIIGGLVGLGLAFLVQSLVFKYADPYGPWGVIHAFAFSNLDNTTAGLMVFLGAVANHGFGDGWKRYWTHPFFIGNFIMLILIPLFAVLARVLGNFRPEMNFLAGIEAGLMDLDSVGAALIFLIATRRFKAKVPWINDDLKGLLNKA